MVESLADRLAKARRPYKPRFEAWIDTLDETDRTALLEAGLDPQLSNRAIADEVAATGYSVGRDTISVWRKSLGLTR